MALSVNDLEALILANVQSQFDTLVLLYTAVSASPQVPATIASLKAQLVTLTSLESTLWDGIATLKKQAQLVLDFAADG